MHRHGVHRSEEREELYGDLVLALAEYKEDKPLEKSFFGLARVMLLSLVIARGQQRRRTITDSEFVEDTVGAGARAGPERIAFREALAHCLRLLRQPLEQDIFRERYLHDRPIQTLAKRHGKSANHISVLLYRATKQMRDCLVGQGFAP